VIRSVAGGRPAVGAPPVDSVALRRLSAYVLDWVVSLIAGWLLVIAAAAVLLVATDLDRHDPSDSALYAALALLSLWPPLWFIYTSLAWARWGATLGMLVLGLAVVARDGALPSISRAVLRTLLLTVLSLPLLVRPALLAAATAFRATGPIVVAVPVASIILLSVAACGSAFLTSGGRAWHDRLSGTLVTRISPAGLDAAKVG